MRRCRKTLHGGCILLAAAAVLSMLHSYHLDGLDGWILSRLEADSTVYADKYTDRAFRSIKRGMFFSDVIDLLGPPLDVWAEKDDSWFRVPYSDVSPVGSRIMSAWSKSPESRSYHIRRIVFENGVVDRKISSFYLD